MRIHDTSIDTGFPFIMMQVFPSTNTRVIRKNMLYLNVRINFNNIEIMLPKQKMILKFFVWNLLEEWHETAREF